MGASISRPKGAGDEEEGAGLLELGPASPVSSALPHISQLPEPVLLEVLRRVSVFDGGYDYALACKQWLELSVLAQEEVRVRENARLDGRKLLEQLRRFRGLKALRLGPCALTQITDEFLDVVRAQWPSLQRLELGARRGMWPEENTVSAAAIERFFLHCPDLTALVIQEGFTNFSSREHLTPVAGELNLPENLPGPLPRLEHLECPILQTLPEWLWQLTGLKKLSLGSACLESVPEALGNLTEITELGLDFAKLERVPDAVRVLSRLRVLRLKCSDRGWSAPLDALPDWVDELALLEELEVWGFFRFCHLPQSLIRLPRLTRVSFGLAQRLPDGLLSLSCVRQLTLSWLFEQTTLPEELCELALLEVLRVRNCEKLVRLPENLGQLKELRELSINDSGLEELPCSVGSLDNLSDLSLAGCRQLSTLPATFGQLRNLRRLDMRDLRSLQGLPEEFGQLVSLEVLVISRWDPVSVLPACLGSLTALRDLRIRRWRWLSHIPLKMLLLPNLSVASREALRQLMWQNLWIRCCIQEPYWMSGVSSSGPVMYL